MYGSCLLVDSSPFMLHAGPTLHHEVFPYKLSTPSEDGDMPLLKLRFYFRALSQLSMSIACYRQPSMGFFLPFGVFDTKKPLISGLPRPITSTLRFSRPHGVLLLLESIRSCFISDPPLGFGCLIYLTLLG